MRKDESIIRRIHRNLLYVTMNINELTNGRSIRKIAQISGLQEWNKKWITRFVGTKSPYNGNTMQHPKERLRQLLQQPSQKNIDIYVFSSRVRNYDGSELAKFVIENKLGDIIETDSTTNPNTNAMIKTWAWIKWHKGIENWLKSST